MGAHDLADICADVEKASPKGEWDPVEFVVPKLKDLLREVNDHIATQ